MAYIFTSGCNNSDVLSVINGVHTGDLLTLVTFAVLKDAKSINPHVRDIQSLGELHNVPDGLWHIFVIQSSNTSQIRRRVTCQSVISNCYRQVLRV